MNISIDWVAFGTIATFTMAIATFWSLYQNRKQLRELKRQWNEQNRAKVTPILIRKGNKIHLRIRNISNVTTSNLTLYIKISCDNGEINWHENPEDKINGTSLNIEPNGFKDIAMSMHWHETNYQGCIEVKIIYNDKSSEYHKISMGELNIVEGLSDIDVISSRLKTIADEIRQKRL